MSDEPVGHEVGLGLCVSIAIAVLAFLLTSCGGGGSSHEPAPIPQARGVLQVGYFGSSPAQLEQTHRHVTVHWAMGWFEDRALTVAAAKQRGLRSVLYLPEAYVSDEATRAFLTTLRAQVGLDSIAYVYPADEPDLTHGATAINEANNRARKIAAELGISPRIAVIYAGSDNFPGVESADLVGLDDYGKGSNVLGIDYDRLRSVLRPDQRLMLVPGGVEPWKQDPAPFFAYARAHADVEMVTSFLWIDFADRGLGRGIGSNGLAPAYCREAIAFTGGTC